MALPPVLADSLRIPVVGAPLFIISNPDLVIAQCKAGVVGSFPSLNARPAEELEVWLKKITEELDAHNQANPDRPAAPFAVNQIVHGSNDRLQHDLEMCVKYKAPIVITSLGAKEFVNEAVHSYGGIVLHDIINNTFADTAVSGNVLTNDTDAEGDTQTVTTTTVTTVEGVVVTIDPTTGEYTYTPPAGYVGQDSFEYTVCDENVGLVNSTYFPQLDVATAISFPQNVAWAVRFG